MRQAWMVREIIQVDVTHCRRERSSRQSGTWDFKEDFNLVPWRHPERRRQISVKDCCGQWEKQGYSNLQSTVCRAAFKFTAGYPLPHSTEVKQVSALVAAFTAKKNKDLFWHHIPRVILGCVDRTPQFNR